MAMAEKVMTNGEVCSKKDPAANEGADAACEDEKEDIAFLNFAQGEEVNLRSVMQMVTSRCSLLWYLCLFVVERTRLLIPPLNFALVNKGNASEGIVI